jgi:hypothetical protein
MNSCASGPIASAKATVPTPTVPPSSHPVTRTVSSMPVRTTRTERPVRRTRPVISPSRGPGPNAAPMYIPVATPHSVMPSAISVTRQANGARSGSRSSDQFIARPIRIALLTVPSPGHCRSGIQSSNTAAPTTITTVPIASPRCPASP